VIKDKIIFDLNGKNGIIKGDVNILKMVREKFSVPNPSYTGRKFSPRKYVITPSSVFEIGLLNDIISYIDSLDIPIDIHVTPELKNAFSPKYDSYAIQSIDGFTYYDHQLNTIREFLDNGRGIGLLATAAGKSLILAGLAKTLVHYKPDTKILVIVPNTGLLNQIYYSFLEEFNLPIISRWGDGNKPDLTKNVLVANTQILTSDVKESIEILKNFDCVIVDEVHRLGEKTNQINKVVHNIDTPHKFGLTGTLPDNYLAAWNTVGKIGPILYEESSYSIRLKGVASKVKIKIIICEHEGQPEKPIKIGNNPLLPTAFYEKEKEFVYSSPIRNNIILKLSSKLNGNALILVDTLDYGNHLHQMLQTLEGKQVYFIQGSMSTEDRQKIIQEIENNDNVITVAMSQIFSTGISVKNLKYLFFTMIGKSTVKISQSIGRIMRLHENKDEAIIFDIADNTSYSISHLKQRIALYKKDMIPFEIKKLKF
jgi:superfamily II DNA or RNA helicase